MTHVLIWDLQPSQNSFTKLIILRIGLFTWNWNLYIVTYWTLVRKLVNIFQTLKSILWSIFCTHNYLVNGKFANFVILYYLLFTTFFSNQICFKYRWSVAFCLYIKGIILPEYKFWRSAQTRKLVWGAHILNPTLHMCTHMQNT